MENLNFNMNDVNRQENGSGKIVPGSEGWLGGPEIEEAGVSERVEEKAIEQLPEGIGLDGQQFEIPVPRNYTLEKEETMEEAEIIPENIEDAAEMVLPVFKNSISRGVSEGWDNESNNPTKKFIEVEGADLEKAVKELHLKREEECIVYKLIRNEMPIQNERERIVIDALLKRASRYCPN